MARTKISEFSATPANNTDIDSINIAEGCAPSGINDAIRELMAQLKDFQTGAVGDSFNGPIGTSTAAAGAFTTLSASSTTTLSGLTASTALALDASKNVVSVTNTGTGNNVLATSPTLVTPILGTPTSATLTNATGLPISTGVSGLGTGVATFLATPSSANLRSALTDETGTGSAVFATSPTLVTPVLGTPTSATLTNATGLPLTTGVTGTLPTANGGTNLTSFTSGGVVYASSTSALATGSALTYNGTVLTASASASTTGNFKTTSSTAQAFNLTASNDANTTIGLGVYGSASGANGMIGSAQPFFGTAASDLNIYNNNASGVIKFGVGSSITEGMRLTSTGLGIGTSSPATTTASYPASWQPAFQVYGGTNAIGIIRSGTGDARLNLVSGGASTNQKNWFIDATTAGALSIATGLDTLAGTERLKIDSAGNLGLGVTPSAWYSLYRAQQIGYGGNIYGGNGLYATLISVGANHYVNSAGNNIYLQSEFASAYQQVSGTHKWLTAPSGTAGNAISFTQAATLTANGEYLVGLTSATGVAKLQVSGALRTTGFTVATLPAGTVGMRTYVTDALAPSFSATVVGGGAVTIPVFYNGTNWIVA